MAHLRLAALVSGSGSNLQSIIDSIERGNLDASVVSVIASRYNIPAEERAAKYGLYYSVVSRREYGDNTEAMSLRLAEILETKNVDLVLLCGFLSFLSRDFVSLYRGRIMNIHPSLLPAFGGKGAYGIKVHQAVLDYGAKISGCTVMFVDEGEDSGPIILQKAVEVREGDTAETLANRVMMAEHIAYPEAVSLFGMGRLQIEGRKVIISEG